MFTTRKYEEQQVHQCVVYYYSTYTRRVKGAEEKVKGDFFGLSIKSTVDACPYVRRTDVKVLAKPRGPHIFKSESHSSERPAFIVPRPAGRLTGIITRIITHKLIFMKVYWALVTFKSRLPTLFTH